MSDNEIHQLEREVNCVDDCQEFGACESEPPAKTCPGFHAKEPEAEQEKVKEALQRMSIAKANYTDAKAAEFTEKNQDHPTIHKGE